MRSKVSAMFEEKEQHVGAERRGKYSRKVQSTDDSLLQYLLKKPDDHCNAG